MEWGLMCGHCAEGAFSARRADDAAGPIHSERKKVSARPGRIERTAAGAGITLQRSCSAAASLRIHVVIRWRSIQDDVRIGVCLSMPIYGNTDVGSANVQPIYRNTWMGRGDLWSVGENPWIGRGSQVIATLSGNRTPAAHTWNIYFTLLSQDTKPPVTELRRILSHACYRQ